jgi:TPR repeat protein
MRAEVMTPPRIAGLLACLAAIQPALAQKGPFHPCTPENYVEASPAVRTRFADTNQFKRDVQRLIGGGEYQAVLAILCRGARSEVAIAEGLLGAVLAEGALAVMKDERQARYWLTRAAGRGDPDAQLSLGNFYFNGMGGPVNVPEAMRMFRLAADSGHAEAQFRIAVEYFDGRYIERNLEEAERLAESARLKGEPRAAEFVHNIRCYRGKLGPDQCK